MDKNQITDIYPLSPMQQGMLFETLYLSGTSIYVERSAIHLSGTLNIPAFKRAWHSLVARHPVFRTLFLYKDRDKPLQVVRRNANLPWRHLDWRDIPPAEHKPKLAQLLDDERQTEFDLQQAPLIRLTLIHLADESYFLAIIFHHLIIDRWSIGLMLNELMLLYGNENNGESNRLPAVRPFGDYIAWIQQQDPVQLEQFWRQNLAGFMAPTTLSIEHNHRPTVGKANYGQAETWLSPEKLTNLVAWSKKHRLTLNTVLQGAWALLLSAYSGEKDVLFGATVAGRPADLDGVEQMMGLFINTLPVRVQVSADTSLTEWLIALQAQMAALQQHVHTPLVEVQGWSDVSADSPLFKSIIVFENIPIQSLPGDTGLQLSGVGVTVRGQMAYPLTVTVSPNHGGRMWLQLTYEQEQFSRQAIQRLTEHLKNLLENIPEQGQRTVTAVSYLSPAEEAQLLHEFSGAARETAVSNLLIHQAIEKQAAQTPAALALATVKATERPSFFFDAAAESMPEASLTYAELNRRANQLARHLLKMGVEPEQVVAVRRTRSAETLICLLAVLKAGGVYLPLDPALPEQRLAHILADAQPVVMITDANAPIWEGTPAFCPEQIADQIAAYATVNVERPLTADNSAYLIYTSGTTGQPKGVLVPHRALINHAQAIRKQFDLSPVDRVLQFAALSFDVALEEILPTWLAGAALLLRPLDVPALDEFSQLVAAEELTVINLPAPYWHEWVGEMTRTPFFTPPESLRLTVVGSDKVMTEKLTQWQESMPDRVKLLNGYGPTETTITATLYPAVSTPPNLAVVPLGQPIENVTAYVLDGNGRLAPVGVVGELYLGGAGLAHGYLNQPGQTAMGFIPNPFSKNPGQRLYKTGDLARWLSDGDLAFVGRTDHQVKIRGFRIELEEVENILTQHSGVQQAIVIADDSRDLLAAYILPDDLSLTSKNLQSWAKGELPDYMVPNSWLLLDKFPLTNSGKVNRQALPDPTFDMGADAYVAPRREDEETIAAIWSEVLDIEKVGIHDNFFQLGGHSLRATQIVSRMRQQLGWDVPIRAIFESPTIAGLSARYAPTPITDDDVMAELVDELEGLSEQDLAALLELTEQ